jgi:hypothetical protein
MNEVSDNPFDLIEKLPKKAGTNLLVAAIDEMQCYNGQSVKSAICRAMGAKESHTEKGDVWILPSVKKLKETFNY